MAANSQPRRKNGPSPLSALPLPSDAPAEPQDDDPAASLPTGSTGELTPAQRARLGLDIYGDEPAPATQPVPVEPDPSANSDFGFADIDPFEGGAAEAQPEPRLAPVQSTPKLAPATPAAVRLRQRDDAEDDHDPSDEAASRNKPTVAERDGTPQLNRDRNVLTYGVAWTFLCIAVTAGMSFLTAFSSGNGGPTPSTFVPAMVSILAGWVVVFIGRNMKAWGWMMVVPVVILVLGPYFYATWQVGQVEAAARAYLSPTGAKAEIDIDARSIVSGTVDTPTGCFAFTQDRGNKDVRVDVVTYLPATAQQQATFALAPRYARRVAPGGTRATQRAFTLEKGTFPVVAEELLTPSIDCARNTGG